MWAVPLILTGSSQTTNNALIVWDLTMQVWLPPFVFPFGIASMTTAYHYNANAPQKLGDLGLYAGDYTGTIYRLFDPALTTDASAAITGFAEWGYLGHGQPDAEKFIRKARFYGLTNGSELMFKVSGLVMNENFTRSTSDPKQITGLSTEAGMAYMDLGQGQMNKGNLHEYRVDFDAYTEIDMIQVQIDNLREKPAT